MPLHGLQARPDDHVQDGLEDVLSDGERDGLSRDVRDGLRAQDGDEARLPHLSTKPSYSAYYVPGKTVCINGCLVQCPGTWCEKTVCCPRTVTENVCCTVYESQVVKKQVPVTVCKKVPYTVCEQVPVTTCQLVAQECVKQVPVTTCRLVSETCVKQVP